MTESVYNCDMQLTLKIKLIPSAEQKDSLLRTFTAFNCAANDAARAGFEGSVFSQPSIHKLCYTHIRKTYNLTAQLAVRAIGKAVECFKRDKKKCPKFKPRSAVVYDQRIMSFKRLTHVSLASLDGRLVIPMLIGRYQETKWQAAIKSGQADLVYVRGEFYLLLSLQYEDVPPAEVAGVLGVDLGVARIAVDSEGNVYSGEALEARRIWIQGRRDVLQSVGTKSAKRRLKKISRHESNYRRTANHQIARRIVDLAKGTNAAIALENLKGVRGRTRFRKKQRARMTGWAFGQLTGFIEYKAALAGVRVVKIDPRNTSRTCYECGHCDKANRQSQSEFVCQSCGHETNADLNAAKNIRDRGYINGPMVGIVDGKAKHYCVSNCA
jgi:IS605 OrfB family transposase